MTESRNCHLPSATGLRSNPRPCRICLLKSSSAFGKTCDVGCSCLRSNVPNCASAGKNGSNCRQSSGNASNSATKNFSASLSEERQRLREELRRLPPEERKRLRDTLRRLPPEERQRLREAWRRASPDERQRLLEEARNRGSAGQSVPLPVRHGRQEASKLLPGAYLWHGQHVRACREPQGAGQMQHGPYKPYGTGE